MDENMHEDKRNRTYYKNIRATLRTLRVLASPSARSYNRAYLASANTFAQIRPSGELQICVRRYPLSVFSPFR